MPPHSCEVPGQEARHVHEREDRDVEGVAEAHEAGGLLGGADVEHAGELRGLVAHDADRAPVQPREADDDVAREVLLHLEELAVVDEQVHHVAHVVRLVRVVRDDAVELRVLAVGVVARVHLRRQLEVVLRQERHQVAHVLEAALLVVGGEVRHAGLRVVRHRPAELLELHLLAGDRLDHVGAGDEHVRGLLDHEDEVGHGRGVDGAARAGPHDHRDLRDHAGAHARCGRTRRRRRPARPRPPGCARRRSR